VDQLAAAGQTWWQVLPLGPTGYGHSPYQALSSFAANPLVLSPDQLKKDGLLGPGDGEDCSFPSGHVAFDKVIPFKERVLARAWKNFRNGARPDLRAAFDQFCGEKAAPQADLALFMALRAKFRGAPFQEWPGGLASREPQALAQARRELADAMDQFRFGQFMLLRHWQALKEHANRRGVRLLGDLPVFVSRDSSDVWANPELFLLDDNARPRVVAGVPPDYFSAEGQLWGNPIYDWEAMRQTGYRWWINRLQARLDYLDAIRIDHFRGFEAAWHVPAEAPTAAAGRWVPGPGADFFDKARQALGGLPLLAEDLGVITPAVTALRDQFQLPGMRVLQFAFNGEPNNPHLPHHCVHNGVIYTGTHDNDTTRGWYDTLPDPERRNLWNVLQRPPGAPHEAVWELIRLAWSSSAALAITPFQDLLGLGSAARMNIPGRADGQWRWRCPEQALTDPAWLRLHELTRSSSRLADSSTEFQAPSGASGESRGRRGQAPFHQPQPTTTTNQQTP
jgi:4-alpha-glucanotransferase